MVAGLILFIIGAIVGGVAVIINQRMVELQVEALEEENEKLLEKIHKDRVEYERARAYRKGYFEGSKEVKKD